MPNINAAIAAMDKACRIWSCGYDQSARWNIYNGGETDCSALVIWALRQGGFDTGGATYTGNLSYNLTRRGWLRLPANLGILQPGDILLNDNHHVCMVISGHGHNAIIAQASIDERGRASGGRAGDQTGYETNERRVYSYRHGWDCILRYMGAGATPAPAKQAGKPTSGALVVDGIWGAATTLVLQRHFGTPADGIVSSQYAGNRGILKACAGGWQWVSHAQGSQLITKMQKALGVDADGIMGKQTVNALERRYGFAPDGFLGYPSNTVKEMQRGLNNGAGVTTAPAKQASKPTGGGIAVDGFWGAATTSALQRVLKTTVDGIVSSQEVQNRGILKACTGGWQWVSRPQGSRMIIALQKKLGVAADGIMGRQTVNALERRYGFAADGHLDGPSNTVRKMQQAINAGRF